jgi:hypothetical protein
MRPKPTQSYRADYDDDDDDDDDYYNYDDYYCGGDDDDNYNDDGYYSDDDDYDHDYNDDNDYGGNGGDHYDYNDDGYYGDDYDYDDDDDDDDDYDDDRSAKTSGLSTQQFKIFYQSHNFVQFIKNATGCHVLSMLKHAQTYRRNISVHKIDKDAYTAPIFLYIIRQQQSMWMN